MKSCPTLRPIDCCPPVSSVEFPRQEYWSGLPFPPPEDLLDPGIKPSSPALTGRLFTAEPAGKPQITKRMDLGHVGSVVVMLGLSCLAIYDVFLDQGSNHVPWEVDS